MKTITILGSTGSIGINTLDVVARHPEKFKVVALTAHQNLERLFEQCVTYHPRYAVLNTTQAADELRARLKPIYPDIEVLVGTTALSEIASLPEIDMVMAAIVGAAGLLPTLAAVRAGKQVLLANKEALVMAGSLFMQAVKEHQAVLLPIDSEHNAIFQCLPSYFEIGKASPGVRKIILTASGGAFRDYPLADLAKVTPEQACTHPNWNMGRKITVDCATMLNKGLEVIEASWLFGLPAEKIEVVLHPQSTVHSLVEYVDGSMLAQLGNPDMRTPIAHALAWPDRIENGVASLDLLTQAHLDFLPLDLVRYSGLNLAYQALKTGGTATTILNAANEVAVQAFLEKKIAFTAIVDMCARVLDKLEVCLVTDLDMVLQADAVARECAKKYL